MDYVSNMAVMGTKLEDLTALDLLALLPNGRTWQPFR